MRHAPLVPSLALGASLVSACGGAGGRVEAHWGPADSLSRLRATAFASWCRDPGVILLQATDQDRAVGFSWRFDRLRPDSIPLTPGTGGDSAAVRASAALRDVKTQELRGWQSISGFLRVTEVDSLRLSAHVDAMMLRVGRADTTHLVADFRNVALTRDSTLCRR